MRISSKIGIGIALIAGLCACSLYQSPSRKFLEKQAYEYAGVKAAENQISCQHGQTASVWVPFSQTPQADVYTHELNEFELRVVTKADPEFSCDYQFSSAQEMYEKAGDAVDLTVAQTLQH